MSWRRKWQPIPVFLPGKSSGQRNLAGYSPWGHKRVRHNLATSFVDNVLIWYTYYCNIIIPKHSLTSPLCCTTIILFMVRTFNNNSCGNSQVSNTVLSTLVTMVHSRFPELIHFLTGEVYTYFFFFFFLVLTTKCGLWDHNFLTRDWTRVRAVKVWNLNHWITKEFPGTRQQTHFTPHPIPW